MADARPRREDEHEPCVGERSHRPALVRTETGEEARATRDAAPALGDLDFTAGDEHVGALVHLMLLQLLAAGKPDRDRPGLVV